MIPKSLWYYSLQYVHLLWFAYMRVFKWSAMVNMWVYTQMFCVWLDPLLDSGLRSRQVLLLLKGKSATLFLPEAKKRPTRSLTDSNTLFSLRSQFSYLRTHTTAVWNLQTHMIPCPPALGATYTTACTPGVVADANFQNTCSVRPWNKLLVRFFISVAYSQALLRLGANH